MLYHIKLHLKNILMCAVRLELTTIRLKADNSTIELGT